jgi:hypothetical protein
MAKKSVNLDNRRQTFTSPAKPLIMLDYFVEFWYDELLKRKGIEFSQCTNKNHNVPGNTDSLVRKSGSPSWRKMA